MNCLRGCAFGPITGKTTKIDVQTAVTEAVVQKRNLRLDMSNSNILTDLDPVLQGRDGVNVQEMNLLQVAECPRSGTEADLLVEKRH